MKSNTIQEIFPQTTKQSFKKKTTVLLGLLLSQFLIFSYFGYFFNLKTLSPIADGSVQLPTAPMPDDLYSSVKIFQHILKEDDSFFEVLQDFEIPPQQILKLVQAAKPLFSLKKIKPGQTLHLVFNPVTQMVPLLTYEIDFTSKLVLKPDADGYAASIQKIPLQVELKTVAQTIERSLYEDGVQAGLSAQKIMELTDIFSWDIDFFVDLRKGDSFTILFEEKVSNGEKVVEGKILAAAIENSGTVHRAFYYEVVRGKGGYYDEKGRSLRKQFLKSPLRYSRISSGFTRRRFHPILKKYRPHYGIDYAAPTGTPVEAIADGTVIFVGRKADYGKHIRIRHNNRYVSYYGHLSRYARGIRRGGRVGQGQVIGRVGATGLATGPHLDFRMTKNGRFINPLRIKNPVAKSVPGKQRADFQKFVKSSLAQLSGKEEKVMTVAK